jgi:hypothetical protein
MKIYVVEQSCGAGPVVEPHYFARAEAAKFYRYTVLYVLRAALYCISRNWNLIKMMRLCNAAVECKHAFKRPDPFRS